MRSIGIALVVLGALILGYGGLSSASGGTDGPVPAATGGEGREGNPMRLRPVFGGIALVTGLIVLASNGRKE